MLGHLSQLISKRSSIADVRSKPISAKHYKLCCCDQRYDDILGKSGRACQVYSYQCEIYRFIVDISTCRSCICMHAFYTIVTDECSHICRRFCFRVTLVYNCEFRTYELALLTICKCENWMQYHVFQCCQSFRSSYFIESNHLKLTNHFQRSDLKNEKHFSIGHCFCQSQNEAVLLIHSWCKGRSRTLKCYWLNFSTLAYMLLFENIHRNFRKLTEFFLVNTPYHLLIPHVNAVVISRASTNFQNQEVQEIPAIQIWK